MKTRQRVLTIAVLAASACTAAPEGREAVSSPVVPEVSRPLVLQGTGYEAAAQVVLPAVPPAEAPGLHNVYRLSNEIISGGEPEGAEGLEAIASWGVKTILSVDGKVPDAATAERLGMRYVHVPIQYSGIDEEELVSIAKTFRELDGPFYVHCYHGKHRGPAAAAIGRIVLDGVPRDRAIAEMRQWCATSSKYEGLYSTVATVEIPAPEATAASDFDFSPAHSFEGLRGGMVQMARKWDLVTAARERGWAADPLHPDVEPLQELTQLHQVYEALAGLDEIRAWPDDFRAWLEDGRSGSEALVRALTESSMASAGEETTWRAAADTAYARVSNSCSACHKAYRD